MNQAKAKELLNKFKLGQLTEQERALLESWYLSWKVNDELDLSEAELEKDFRQMRANIPMLQNKVKQVSVWQKIAAAASVLLILGTGIWLYNTRHLHGGGDPSLRSGQAADLLNYAHDIAPGKNTATLTLPDGTTLNLSDAKTGVIIGEDLKYNDGTAVEHEDLKAIARLTASTPRGGTYQITLPDGTKVWLNADSKLEFPSKFSTHTQRIVKLTGEGYFEVTKNKARPFVVQTDKQEVTVLGTHFNINSYAGENTVKTTLLEGSVRVSSSRKSAVTRDNVVLKPNQQSVLSGNDRIMVNKVDAEDAIAWKNGLFVFEDEPLESIMKRLARWYNIEVKYETGIDKMRPYGGSISRYDHISAVLDVLESTKNIHFKIEGRSILVMK